MNHINYLQDSRMTHIKRLDKAKIELKDKTAMIEKLRDMLRQKYEEIGLLNARSTARTGRLWNSRSWELRQMILLLRAIS